MIQFMIVNRELRNFCKILVAVPAGAKYICNNGKTGRGDLKILGNDEGI